MTIVTCTTIITILKEIKSHESNNDNTNNMIPKKRKYDNINVIDQYSSSSTSALMTISDVGYDTHNMANPDSICSSSRND